MQYENSNNEEKEKLKEKYCTHIKEKDLCREQKLQDRQKINDTNLCVVYDMQAQMPSPNGDTSAFSYKSKLNSENFTVVELSKKKKILMKNVAKLTIMFSHIFGTRLMVKKVLLKSDPAYYNI